MLKIMTEPVRKRNGELLCKGVAAHLAHTHYTTRLVLWRLNHVGNTHHRRTAS